MSNKPDHVDQNFKAILAMGPERTAKCLDFIIAKCGDHVSQLQLQLHATVRIKSGLKRGEKPSDRDLKMMNDLLFTVYNGDTRAFVQEFLSYESGVDDDEA